MTQHPLKLLDTHAGGDVSRIVYAGVGPIPGSTVREKMAFMQKSADDLRKLLLSEPYGIPEMSIDLLVPSNHPDAAAGYIIMEVMGYPIYSGSNTLCTATAVLELGIVPKQEGRQEFKLESPAGLVDIAAQIEDGVVKAVTCAGLPSYIEQYQQRLSVPKFGTITYSIAYSGGFYILVDATSLGFSLERNEEQELAACAHQIVTAVRQHTQQPHHFSLGDVGPIPFLHFMGPVEQTGPSSYAARSATYVHPGVICRSTTGTGTSARLALMQHEGLLNIGDTLETCSLRNTRFIGQCRGIRMQQGKTLIDNSISGRAFVLSNMSLHFNADDPMVQGLSLPMPPTSAEDHGWF